MSGAETARRPVVQRRIGDAQMAAPKRPSPVKKYTKKLKYFITWHIKTEIQSKTQTNHQELSYNHIKKHNRTREKYLKIYKKKQNITLFRKYFINNHQKRENIHTYS